MISENPFKPIESIVETLLDESASFEQTKESLQELKVLFFEATGLNLDAEVNKEGLLFPMGEAIAPVFSAMCIDDVLRTKRFIMAMDMAISEHRKINSEKPVTILYAGTGPFAALVWPLLAKYTPKEVQLILLEAHTVCIDSVKRLLKAYDAYDYVKEMYHCDASNFQFEKKRMDVDIVLIECLHQALAREPQVAITFNLIPQLKNDVVLIPEQVRLDLSFIDMNEKKESCYFGAQESIETVFEVSKESVQKYFEKSTKSEISFESRIVMLDEEKKSMNDLVAISTEVIILDPFVLTTEESGLTIPYSLINLDVDSDIKGVETLFVLGQYPKLLTRFID